MVEDTSREAYHQDAARLELQRERVYQAVCDAMHPSSRDIARILDLSRTSVTGRLKELEDDGLIEKAAKKIDPWSRHQVWWYRPR